MDGGLHRGVEARELQYFIAVAEELHFGRAAERVGITQPPLSRAIQRLERRLGLVLLDRTSQTVTLTPAGSVFLVESRAALQAIASAVETARRAAGHTRPLRVAMKPNGDAGLMNRLLPIFRQLPEVPDVEIQVCGIGEQTTLLREGQVELAFVHVTDDVRIREAFHDDVTGLDTEHIETVEHVAAVPSGHRFARQSILTYADLENDPLPLSLGPGSPPPAAPQGRDAAQLMQLIGVGQLLGLGPASIERHPHADVTIRRLVDPPRSSTLLAWLEHSRSQTIATFVRTASELVRQDQSPEKPVPGRDRQSA